MPIQKLSFSIMGRDLVTATGNTRDKALAVIEEGDGDEHLDYAHHVPLPEHEACYNRTELRKRIAEEEALLDEHLDAANESDAVKLERNAECIAKLRAKLSALPADSPQREELEEYLESAESYDQFDMQEEREARRRAADDQEAVIALLNFLRRLLSESGHKFIAFNYG